MFFFDNNDLGVPIFLRLNSEGIWAGYAQLGPDEKSGLTLSCHCYYPLREAITKLTKFDRLKF